MKEAVPQRRACEFYLLRYMPDAVRNEFVHIGVLLREQETGRVDVRFTRDWRRVRCLDPDADTDLLEGMEGELKARLQADPKNELLHKMRDQFSLNVQITEPKAYLAESFPAGMEELMRLYVDPHVKARLPKMSGRSAIQNRMRAEFEQAGVWDVLRKRIAASDYTRPGDPLRIDMGYRPNGKIRMFHAVSLEPGVEMAKVLAFSAASLKAGVERIEKAELELTAIVEPITEFVGEDEENERRVFYRFGIETMEENHIRVLTTSDMHRVAETAKRELEPRM
jgi:hypothetical protein